MKKNEQAEPEERQEQALVRRDSMELTLEAVADQVRRIQQLMSAHMQEGAHYGVIPGTDKPTLLKPGAEKLLLMFRLDPEYKVERAIEEPERIHYVIRCTLYHSPTRNRIASGLGSCNSWESKYRWRTQDRSCPNCGKETIKKSKFKPEWYCYAKIGGCGATFPLDDSEIKDQQLGKIENSDPWDQANTILKMACKRALVAAVLNGTAASDIFTQDLEDMGGGDSVTDATTKREQVKERRKEELKINPVGEEQIVELEEWSRDARVMKADYMITGKNSSKQALPLLRTIINDHARLSREAVQQIIDYLAEDLGTPQVDDQKPAAKRTEDITDDDIPF